MKILALACLLPLLPPAARAQQTVSGTATMDSSTWLVTAGPFERIYDPSTGEQEAWYVNDHTFVYGPGGAWHLFGITHAEPADPMDEDHFAHATADSLLQSPWRKEPFALDAEWDPWREVHLWAPYVLLHDGLYYMFYCAGDTSHARYKIHLATSPDLRTWARHPANPVVVDGYDARDPFILRVGDRWVMYYTATSEPDSGRHVVAYRTSTDLVHWGERRVAYEDESSGTYGGPTESPFVVRRGVYYYLFIGPRNGRASEYVGTDVFRSRDPFHWTYEDCVGHIRSHAAEVVRDIDGKWYVSRAGWGQGGVYLAPLYWKDGLDEKPT
ncbi:MAG TPA: hypothetical protein VFG50_07360, partial [Rhodothermales bacterium]|nr:hypothetical protein [Rhodothermales bacterium]